MTWEINTHNASLMPVQYPDQTKIVYSCETLNSAILDSGAPKNVCGKKWLEQYINTLTSEEQKKVVYTKSHNVYKFGCGSKCLASKKGKFPSNNWGEESNT